MFYVLRSIQEFNFLQKLKIKKVHLKNDTFAQNYWDLMKKTFLFLIVMISLSATAQIRELKRGNTWKSWQTNQNVEDTQSVVETKDRPPIDQYKIISAKNDTITADTTLTIQKAYKYNYLRKDDFELLPFHNIGSNL